MFVYVAPLKNMEIFKVGYTHNPNERFGELSEFYDFDYDNIFVIECPNRSVASGIESTLKQVCGKHRVISKLGGGTELFSKSVMGSVTHLLASLAEIGNYRYVKVDPRKIESFKALHISSIKDSEIKEQLVKFVKIIRLVRLEANLTQSDVAKQCGVSRQTIARLEKTGICMIEILLKVCIVLNIEINMDVVINKKIRIKKRARNPNADITLSDKC